MCTACMERAVGVRFADIPADAIDAVTARYTQSLRRILQGIAEPESDGEMSDWTDHAWRVELVNEAARRGAHGPRRRQNELIPRPDRCT